MTDPETPLWNELLAERPDRVFYPHTSEDLLSIARRCPEFRPVIASSMFAELDHRLEHGEDYGKALEILLDLCKIHPEIADQVEEYVLKIAAEFHDLGSDRLLVETLALRGHEVLSDDELVRILLEPLFSPERKVPFFAASGLTRFLLRTGETRDNIRPTLLERLEEDTKQQAARYAEQYFTEFAEENPEYDVEKKIIQHNEGNPEPRTRRFIGETLAVEAAVSDDPVPEIPTAPLEEGNRSQAAVAAIATVVDGEKLLKDRKTLLDDAEFQNPQIDQWVLEPLHETAESASSPLAEASVFALGYIGLGSEQSEWVDEYLLSLADADGPKGRAARAILARDPDVIEEQTAQDLLDEMKEAEDHERHTELLKALKKRIRRE